MTQALNSTLPRVLLLRPSGLKVLAFDASGSGAGADRAPTDASLSSCDARSHVVSELPIGGSTDVMLSE
jgi:hypothetical protein